MKLGPQWIMVTAREFILLVAAFVVIGFILGRIVP